MTKEYFAHQTAVIDQGAQIGKGSKIWHFCHLMPGAKIGENCILGQNVFVGKAIVGDGCKVQNNISLFDGVTLEENVFCGPYMVFTNVLNPRAHVERKDEFRTTLVKKGSTIGANSTIICGNTLGAYSMIGSGAVVTKDVPDFALVVGNPAKRIGWVCSCGNRIYMDNSAATCGCGRSYRLLAKEVLVPEKKKIDGVPLLDLGRQYALIGGEMEKALIDCARSGRYILGDAVEKFEKESAEYCGVNHAIGVTSGSDALIVALMAEGIGPGDKVITSAFTFFATGGAIWRVGATPIFVDIEPDGFNIDPAKVEQAAGQQGVKAIMVVHLFGQCADMDAIMDIAKKYDLCVIEDAAQSIGSEYKGKRAGSIGHYGCFSFFPSKNLGCMGDGGLVTTNDPERAKMVKMLRNHGSQPKYYHKYVGGNFRIDAMQAAVLSVKLPYLDSWTKGRQKNAATYEELFAKAKMENVQLPAVLPERRHIYNQFTLRIKNGLRDRVLKSLRERKIGCEVYYPVPLHLQECFADLNYKPGDIPLSEQASDEVISIPIFPELTTEEQQYVVDSFAEILG